MNQISFQYINLDYLEMMTDGDSEMKKEILGIVIEEIENEIPKMLNFFKAGDIENTNHISHKFKSTLAFVGNNLMTDANKEAELITKMNGDYTKLPELFAMVEKMQPKVLAELQIYYDTL